MVSPQKDYRVAGKSDYFKEKYGNYNPAIRLLNTAEEHYGKRWTQVHDNKECKYFALRCVLEKLPIRGIVWYGTIDGNVELVHGSELEVVK